LIQRFSEDIDLILDWRLLGYEKDEPWQDRSKTKQDAFNKEADARAAAFLANAFLPTFAADLSEIIEQDARVEIDQVNPQIVNFHYPQLFSANSILQSICLELGALAAWTPAVERPVQPYVFEQYPKLAQATSTTILTSSAERTFWEKVTILHHEANRPAHLDMPARYSRHYYDLYCISRTGHKSAALKQLELLQKVVAFKMKFYPRAWAKYEEAIPGSVRLVPPPSRFNALRSDYEGTREMLFGEYPTFDDLMAEIAKLEAELNQS